MAERRDAAVDRLDDLHRSIDLGLTLADAVVMLVASLAEFPLDRVDSFWKSGCLAMLCRPRVKNFLFTYYGVK